MIRAGHEFNGGFYAWARGIVSSALIGAFTRMKSVYRANGHTGPWVWCSGVGQGTGKPDLCYSVDDVVDIIGMDVYNLPKGGTSWDWTVNQPYGLNWLAGFGRQPNKPLAFCEGGAMDDAPHFIVKMAAWIAAHPVVWHAYWESNSGAACSLKDGTKPKSAAAFKAAFGIKANVAAGVPALTVTGSGGATAIVVPNADGSDLIEVTFPTTAANVVYDLKLSSARKGASPPRVAA